MRRNARIGSALLAFGFTVALWLLLAYYVATVCNLGFFLFGFLFMLFITELAFRDETNDANPNPTDELIPRRSTSANVFLYSKAVTTRSG
jgi:hypothetical protein